MRIEENVAKSAFMLVKPLGKEISLKLGEILEAQVVDLFPGGGLTLKVKDSYLPVRTDLAFTLGKTVSLKVVDVGGPGKEVVLQIVGEKSPLIAPESSAPFQGGGKEEQIGTLSQQLLNLIREKSRFTADGPLIGRPQNLPSAELKELKILLGDLLRMLDNEPLTLSEKTKSELRQILQSCSFLRGPVHSDPALDLVIQLIDNKIGLYEEKGINPLPGTDPARIKDLNRSILDEIIRLISPEQGDGPVQQGASSRPAPDMAKLKSLFEDLLKTLPADIRTLPRGVRNEIQILLQASLKGLGDDVQQALVRLSDQLPENMADPFLMQRLKSGLLAPEGLQASELKEALENTGIVFEAKVKSLLEALPQRESGKTAGHPKIDGDLKGALLEIKRLLSEMMQQDPSLGDRPDWVDGTGPQKGEGVPPFAKEPGGVETLLHDIQTYQALSKVTDSFYTYLPIHWSELKRGELVFKRRQHPTGEGSYSCGIHLDLKRLGSLSAFIYMQRLDFFVTFKVDHPGLNRLIQSHLDDLKENFRRAGMNLKTLSSFRDPGDLPDPSGRIESEQTLVSIRI